MRLTLKDFMLSIKNTVKVCRRFLVRTYIRTRRILLIDRPFILPNSACPTKQVPPRLLASKTRYNLARQAILEVAQRALVQIAVRILYPELRGERGREVSEPKQAAHDISAVFT